MFKYASVLLTLLIVLILPSHAEKNSNTGIQVVGLYPTGNKEIQDNDRLIFEYRSDLLTPHSSEGEIERFPLELQNWDLQWFYLNQDEESISEAGDEPFYLGCQVHYQGELDLSTTQQDASKPVVLLSPLRGAKAEPLLPKPSWLASWFGKKAPKRLKNAAPKETNLLMLMVDTLRRDHLPSYGHPFVVAPHMEMLAQLGVVFENSYAASCSTRPSVGTIFTGLHPKAHGAERHSLEGANLYPGIPLMAEVLQAQGMHTATVSSNSQITKAFGFSRGFDHYDCPVSEGSVTPKGVNLLQSLSEPFFLYLHYIAPHQPYKPKPRWQGMYEGKHEHDEQDRYCAEITIDDRRIGQVLFELSKQGLWERTVVWLLSDHGEEFWEHGWNGHGAKLYEESVQTVSVVSYPSRLGIQQRVSEPVTHADILPTITQWFDFPEVQSVHGRSLLSLMEGEPVEWNHPLFLHHGGGLDPGPHPSDKQAILQKNKKLIWWTEKNEWEYYSLMKDPEEKQNQVDLNQDYQAHLESTLKKHLNEAKIIRDSFMKPGATEFILSDKDRENLEHLGYIE